MSPSSPRVLVHAAVLAEVWVESNHQQAAAQRFLLEEIPTRRLRIAVLDSIRVEVLAAMRESLGGLTMDPMIANGLVNDATETLRELVQQPFVETIPVSPLLTPAFILAAMIDLPLNESLYYYLAAATGDELLLLTGPELAKLERLRSQLPELRIRYLEA